MYKIKSHCPCDLGGGCRRIIGGVKTRKEVTPSSCSSWRRTLVSLGGNLKFISFTFQHLLGYK